MADAPEYLTRKEAAALLRLQEGTLRKWASSGANGLPFHKVGGRVLYRREDVEQWIAHRRRV